MDLKNPCYDAALVHVLLEEAGKCCLRRRRAFTEHDHRRSGAQALL